jgi:hypothetical protein
MSKKCEANVRKACRDAELSKSESERLMRYVCPKPIAEFPDLDQVQMPTMEEASETTTGKERYRKERAAEQRRKEKQEKEMLKEH